jgi:hypothetical protein
MYCIYIYIPICVYKYIYIHRKPYLLYIAVMLVKQQKKPLLDYTMGISGFARRDTQSDTVSWGWWILI